MDEPGTSQNRGELRDASRGQRLQRVMADAGVASRRACEQLIEGGHVTVNGQVVRVLPAWVDPSRDRVVVDGQPLPRPEPHLYLMYNKPARTLATPREGSDDARRSVYDMVVHPLSARLFPAGRLDYEATGLLILTNDGALANRLTHARYGVEKTYQMVVRGTLDEASLERINKVIGQVTRRAAKEAGAPRPAQADLAMLTREPGRTVLELVSRDGRASLVRDTLAALGHPVKKMERVGIGPLRLRGVAVGQWRELTREELSDLRRVAIGKPSRAKSTDATTRPRRRAKPAIPTPVVSKRFRGIGRPVDGPTGPGRPGKGGHVRTMDATSRASVLDRRKGRGDGINAYRRKAEAPSGGASPQPRPRGKGSRSRSSADTASPAPRGTGPSVTRGRGR